MNKLKIIFILIAASTVVSLTSIFWNWVFPPRVEFIYYQCIDPGKNAKSITCERVENAWSAGQDNFSLIKKG